MTTILALVIRLLSLHEFLIWHAICQSHPPSCCYVWEYPSFVEVPPNPPMFKDSLFALLFFHPFLLKYHAKYGRNSTHTLPRVAKETISLAAPSHLHHANHEVKICWLIWRRSYQHNAPKLYASIWCKCLAKFPPPSHTLEKDISQDGQTLSRLANAAMPPVALCHRYASASPTSWSPPSPIHPNVGISFHAQNWYSSNGEYHPPKLDFHLFISWDVEMQSLGDFQMKTPHQWPSWIHKDPNKMEAETSH